MEEDIETRIYELEKFLYKNAIDGKIDFGLMLKDLKYLLETNKNLKDENEKLNIKIIDLYKNSVAKSRVQTKIHQFKGIRDEILKLEKDLQRPSITYDLKRNDYCIKLLEELLED